MAQTLVASPTTSAAPRSVGTLRLSAKGRDTRSEIDRFRTSGALKVAFPRRTAGLEAIMVNTSGGLTGGDRFDVEAHAGANSHLVLTTQAAERAYRSQSGAARVRTRLSVAEGAKLHWLPQELIVFDGGHLDRRLDIDVAEGAEAVLVEPVMFGRAAMGETDICGTFRDRITLTREGRRFFRDRIDLSGSISRRLDRPAIAGGMRALASVLYHGPRAEMLLEAVRQLLPRTGGASLVAPFLLTIRILAADALLMRRVLVPVLECVTGTALPKSWSL